jgi:hypothetical protein
MPAACAATAALIQYSRRLKEECTPEISKLRSPERLKNIHWYCFTRPLFAQAISAPKPPEKRTDQHSKQSSMCLINTASNCSPKADNAVKDDHRNSRRYRQCQPAAKPSAARLKEYNPCVRRAPAKEAAEALLQRPTPKLRARRHVRWKSLLEDEKTPGKVRMRAAYALRSLTGEGDVKLLARLVKKETEESALLRIGSQLNELTRNRVGLKEDQPFAQSEPGNRDDFIRQRLHK